jgi:hypothetical protein
MYLFLCRLEQIKPFWTSHTQLFYVIDKKKLKMEPKFNMASIVKKNIFLLAVMYLFFGRFETILDLSYSTLLCYCHGLYRECLGIMPDGSSYALCQPTAPAGSFYASCLPAAPAGSSYAIYVLATPSGSSYALHALEKCPRRFDRI